MKSRRAEVRGQLREGGLGEVSDGGSAQLANRHSAVGDFHLQSFAYTTMIR